MADIYDNFLDAPEPEDADKYDQFLDEPDAPEDPFAQEGPQFQGLPPGASAPISAITGQPVPTSEEQFAGARAALNIVPYASASALRGAIPEPWETAVMQPVTRAVTGRDYTSPITTAQQVSGAQLPPEARQTIGTGAEFVGELAPLTVALKTSRAIMKAFGLASEMVIGNATILERIAHGIMSGGLTGLIHGGLTSPDKIEQDMALFAGLEAGLGATGGVIKKVAQSGWFMKMRAKDQQLVVQTADELLKAGHSEAKIIKTLSNKTERAEFIEKMKRVGTEKARKTLARQVTPEEPVAERLKKKLDVKPVAPKPIPKQVVPKPEPKPPVRPEPTKLPAKELSVKPAIKPPAVEPPVEPPSKPTEIPEFKSTQEAVKFGSKATPEQLEQVSKKIDEFRSNLKEARKIKDFDTAMIEAGKISIYDEAIRAKEILKEHPELFPDIKLPEPKPIKPPVKPPIKVRTPADIAAERKEIETESQAIASRQYREIRKRASKLAVEALKKSELKEDKVALAHARKAAREIVGESSVYKMVDEIKKTGRISYQSLRTTGTSKEEIANILKKYPGIVVKEGGVSADKLSNQFGYDTPDEMLQDMLSAKPKGVALKEVSDSELAEYERYIDEARDLTLTERFAEEEARILIKLMGKKPKARKDLKAIISKKAGLIKPDQEITVKERASLKDQIKLEAAAARKAFAAGKKEAAIKHKIKQLAIIERLKTKYEAKVEKIKTAKDILTNRRALITAIQKHFGLTDKDLRKITTRDIRLMSNMEFKQFKNKIKILAEKFEEKRTARQQLDFHIKEKEINVTNLRKHLKLPIMKNMKLSDIQKLDAALEPYQKGDIFITSRRMKALEGSELGGVKTWREARERMVKEIKRTQKIDVKLKDLEQMEVSEFDRFKYDTGLAESHPVYRLFMEKYNMSVLISNAEILNIKKKLMAIAKKLKPKGLWGRLVPQQKNVFKYMESSQKEKITLTPAELELVKHMLPNLEEAYEYLIKTEAMTRGRENYFVHIRRHILESVKEDGIIKGAKEIFKNYKLDEQNFDVIGKNTNEVLSFSKWFRFSMHRTGVVKPTENVVRAYLTYMKMFKKKQALDEVVPLIDTYAQALTPKDASENTRLLHGNMARFMKEWLNTQKGKHITLVAEQGGKIDATLRSLQLFTTLRDLAFNLPVGVASQFGEQFSNYQALGKIRTVLGKYRQSTKQGKKIIEEYRNFIGENPWSELIEPSKAVGDRLMEGIFILFSDASVRANKTYLLGSITKAEFKSGKISLRRLAELRINLGRYRVVPGMKSIIGATPEGKAIIQYKKWAVPHLRTTISNLGTIGKKIAGMKPGSKEFYRAIRELYQIVEVTGFATLMLGLMVKDENDRSFTGQMARKAYREVTSVLQAISPLTFATAGRVASFIENLAKSLYMLVLLERYKESKELKGWKKLKRELKPVAIKHIFGEDKKKPGGGYYEPSVHKPE